MAAKKYNLISKVCPRCSQEFQTFDGGQNARQYCSRSCAMRSRVLSEETKKQVAIGLGKWHDENNTNPDRVSKLDPEIRGCAYCGAPFPVYNKRLRFCSKVCSSKAMRHSQSTKDKMSKTQAMLYEQKLREGWRPRTAPSYPETVVASILGKLGVVYTNEYPVKRWLIDFADPQRKIAVEIDGSQHRLPKRQASDARKDEYLRANGWQVHRIKWQALSPEFYSQLTDTLQSIFGKDTK